MKLLLVNGPNLNLLGTREPEKYGSTTLKDLVTNIKELAKGMDIEIVSFQSNIEGEIVTFIQQEGENADGMIINAAAFTHTSIAIRDAILARELSFVEVHISNVHSRELFRHKSFLSDIAIGQIVGLGVKGYELALLFFHAKS